MNTIPLGITVRTHDIRDSGPTPLHYTETDFLMIADIMERHSGIRLRASGMALVYSRLAKHVRSRGFSAFSEYCALLRNPTYFLNERDTLVAALTTGFTNLFREPHHFDYLRALMVEHLVPRLHEGQQIRLWSAGCSSGEEALSIALTVLDIDPDAHRHDIRILATDINRVKLDLGRSGIYPRQILTQGRKIDMGAWNSAGARHVIAPKNARRMIDFRYMNLIDTWPTLRPFDAIFCRNVAIYFGVNTNTALWRNMAGNLSPGGLLCVGHAEHIAEHSSLGLKTCGITSYRKMP